MQSKTTLMQVFVPTQAGKFLARYSARGLAKLDFPESAAVASVGLANAASVSSDQIRAWHRLTTTAVKRVLAGRDAGELPPLDLSAGTEFQRAVWRAMRRIGTGQSRSYGDLARAIGRPKAVRAVGGACGANPIPLLVPCHRVLAAGGKIGGFSGGLEWKRKLLAREGVIAG